MRLAAQALEAPQRQVSRVELVVVALGNVPVVLRPLPMLLLLLLAQVS